MKQARRRLERHRVIEGLDRSVEAGGRHQHHAVPVPRRSVARIEPQGLAQQRLGGGEVPAVEVLDQAHRRPRRRQIRLEPQRRRRLGARGHEQRAWRRRPSRARAGWRRWRRRRARARATGSRRAASRKSSRLASRSSRLAGGEPSFGVLVESLRARRGLRPASAVARGEDAAPATPSTVAIRRRSDAQRGSDHRSPRSRRDDSWRSGATRTDFQSRSMTSPGGWPRRFETSAQLA